MSQRSREKASPPASLAFRGGLDVSQVLHSRLREEVHDLRTQHADEVDALHESLSLMRHENDALSVENAALAAALLKDETVILQRLVHGKKTKALIAPGKITQMTPHTPGEWTQEHDQQEQSSFVDEDPDTNMNLTTDAGRRHHQHEQRERTISAATRALLELEALVKAAAERARPQLQLEEEFDIERARHAGVVDELQTTIRRLNDGMQRQRAEGATTTTTLESSLQGMWDRIAEQEAAVRKAATDMAALRAECQRQSAAAERWQAQCDELLTATDQSSREALQRQGDRAAEMEAAHRAQLAAVSFKCSALEQALAAERAAADSAERKLGSDLALLRDQYQDRVHSSAELSRLCEQRAKEVEALQRRVREVEGAAEKDREAAREALRASQGRVEDLEAQLASEQGEHAKQVADLRDGFAREKETWQTETATLVRGYEWDKQGLVEGNAALEQRLTTRMTAERAVATALLEGEKHELSRQLALAKAQWLRDVQAHAEDARVARASAAAADERFLGLDARHRSLEKSADAAVREADGWAADLRTEVEQCRRELAAVRSQLVDREGACEGLTSRLRRAEGGLAETAARLAVEQAGREEAEAARRAEGDALRAKLAVAEGAAKGRAEAAEATRAGEWGEGGHCHCCRHCHCCCHCHSHYRCHCCSHYHCHCHLPHMTHLPPRSSLTTLPPSLAPPSLSQPSQPS